MIAAVACSSATTQTASGIPDQITAADIEKANVITAYDAVDRLARRWFRDMSGNASGEVVVYLDTNQKLGGKEALRDIPAREVVEIRYLKSADAVGRYGQEASGGAIIVTRR
jgi:hypothetical protein